MSRRRQKVVLRVKVRRQKRRKLLALSLVLGLIFAAFAGFERFSLSLAGFDLLGKNLEVSEVRLSGVPPAAEDPRPALAAAWTGRSLRKINFGSVSEEMGGSFPYLEVRKVRRNWLKGRVSVRVGLRPAMARCRPALSPQAGFLSADGRCFKAPEALYGENFPQVEWEGSLPEDGLKKAADFISRSSRETGLEIETLVYSGGGWRGTLADGTRVEWGDLSDVPAMLDSLRLVLKDARSRWGAVSQADLKYMEYGKIIVKR